MFTMIHLPQIFQTWWNDDIGRLFQYTCNPRLLHSNQNVWLRSQLSAGPWSRFNFSHYELSVTKFGTPGGAKNFVRGAHIFWAISNKLKGCPIHFSKVSEKFSRVDFAPMRPRGYGPGWECVSTPHFHEYYLRFECGSTCLNKPIFYVNTFRVPKPIFYVNISKQTLSFCRQIDRLTRSMLLKLAAEISARVENLCSVCWLTTWSYEVQA